jgi:hypothetical protein
LRKPGLYFAPYVTQDICIRNQRSSRRRTLLNDDRNRLPPQIIQHAFRHHRLARRFQAANVDQLKRRIAHPAKLLSKKRLREREFLRLLQYLIPADCCGVSGTVAKLNDEILPDDRLHGCR